MNVHEGRLSFETITPIERARPREMPEHEPLSETTAFSRDVLVALAAHDGASGVELVASLEDAYNEDIDTRRLYPAVNRLVTRGLATKRDDDGRTNTYRLTDAGRAALEADLAWRASALEC